MLSVVLLAALAQAKDFKPAGKAEVSAPVELQLYAGVDPADPFWYVEGKINDKPVLLRLATEVEGLTLTEASAGRVGLKVQGKDTKTAAVAAVALGDAKLTGIKANIGAITDFGYGTDGVLGIASLADAAWSISPDTGKVTLAPAGSGIVEGVGAALPFQQSAKEEVKVATSKRPKNAVPMAADLSVSGVALRGSLATGRKNSWAAQELDGADWFTVDKIENKPSPLPAVDGLRVGDVEEEWREVSVGGHRAWSMVSRAGMGLGFAYSAPARVGQDVLSGSVLALDTNARTFALKPASKNAALPYGDVLEARLRSELAAAATPEMDADAAKAASAGKATALYKYLSRTPKSADALAAAKQVADNKPQTCDSWHMLGAAELAAGNAAGAVDPLKKAAELYAGWAKRPLEERTKLAASEAKRSKAPDFDGVWAQPNSCFTAYGALASAYVATGRYDDALALFPAQLDLDAGLPLAVGNAALLKGDKALAEAAYRQAVKLSYTESGSARAGMLLVTKDRAPDLARAQFEVNYSEQNNSLRYLQAYADALRAEGGADAAVKGLSDYVARRPNSVAGQLALAGELAAAGRDNSAPRAAAATLLSSVLGSNPRSGAAHALNAEALRLAGNLTEAAAAAQTATELDPGNGLGWFVRARVAESAGDAAKAAEYAKAAGARGSLDPLYATLGR